MKKENTHPMPYLQGLISTTRDGLYMPALAGELPTGKDLEHYAASYVADMGQDGGDALVACHVAIWADFAAALAHAAARHAAR